MTVTDLEVANNVIYRMLENGNADAAFPTLLTSMFGSQEIIDSMDRVQQNFLLETGMIVTQATIAGNVGKPRYDLPTDSIRPRRLTWADASQTYTVIVNPLILLEDGGELLLEGSGAITLEQSETQIRGVSRVLTQVDTWELDNGASNWPADRDIPISWTENTLPQQTVRIAKTPSNDGTIGLLYIALATALTGAGVVLAVPDDWSPYILYGTLAELLSSDGPSFDPVRADYCSRRFQEGIELARLVLGGSA